MTRPSEPAPPVGIPRGVITELLGKGLSYKQWSLILTGEIFNDCFGGRYFTEWQHALDCQSFTFDKVIKQELVDCEMEMFKNEILGMVEQGYTFKCVTRRLRGEAWRSDRGDERSLRSEMGRLMGADTRSKILRLATKKWKLALASTKPKQAAYAKQYPSIYSHDTSYPSTSQVTFHSFHTPSSPAISPSLQSSPSPRTPRTPSPPNHTLPSPHIRVLTTRPIQLSLALSTQPLANQQRVVAIQTMEADLLALKAALHAQEVSIAALFPSSTPNQYQNQNRNQKQSQKHKPLPPPEFFDEFDSTIFQHGLKDSSRCRSRRRGRLFHCNKVSVFPMPVSSRRSRIPVRTMVEKSGGEALSVDTQIEEYRFLIPRTNLLSVIVPRVVKREDGYDGVEGKGIEEEKRGNRDSGYASPGSPFGEDVSLLSARTYCGK